MRILPFLAPLLTFGLWLCPARGGEGISAVLDEVNRTLAPAGAAKADGAAAARAALRDAPPPPAPEAPPLRVRVTARHHTILSSQAGGRIEELTVLDGDRFQNGQLLIRLDSAVAEGQCQKMRAARRRQDLLYEMTRDLAGLQSKGELEVEIARAEAEQAAADLVTAEALLERTRIRAPFSGRVLDVAVREKQFVAEGQALLEIADDADLTLEFLAPSAWIPWFRPGYRFAAAIDELGREFPAEVERLGGKVDPVSQSVKVYARLLDTAPALMVGMSGAARIAPPSP